MDLAAVVLFVLIVGLAIFPGWRVNDRVVTRWARSAGLELSAEGRDAAARYLRWSKRTRTAGGLVGLGVPYLVWVLSGTPGQWPFPVGFVLLGYVAGVLLAEFTVHRPRRNSGAALVLPRRLQDYLPTRWVNLQRGLAVVSVLLIGGYAIAPPHPYDTGPRFDGGVPGLVLIILAGPVIAGITEGLQRIIVNRRQQVAGSEDAQLDDAFRSNSVQALSGAGLAILCALVGSAAFTLAGPLQNNIAEYVLGLTGIVLFVATLFFWVGMAEPRRLRIRRLTDSRSPA